jgi:recombination protein RecA
MNKTATKKKLEAARNDTNKKFGDKAARIGNERYNFNVVPSGSLTLDYRLGIGGFPYGFAVEVFGSNGLGKTSAIGYSVLANVQKQGKLPAIIAVEPHFDAEWAQRLHGLDPDLLLINHPDNAEEAFEMLHDLVYGGLVDYILFDSIGALASESETEEGGKKKAFGASGVITTGLNVVMPRLYKNNQGLMLINQQRHNTKIRVKPGQGTPMESPGGEALKHDCQIRIQLKPGKQRYMAKIAGEDKPIMVGRELVASFVKNKMAQAVNTSARFDFFHIETEEFGFGIDKAADIIRVAKVAGVIEGSGAWLKHPSFPGGKLQGKNALEKYLAEHPEGAEVLRQEVLGRMVENELEAAEKNEQAIEAEITAEPEVDDDKGDDGDE